MHTDGLGIKYCHSGKKSVNYILGQDKNLKAKCNNAEGLNTNNLMAVSAM